MEIRKVAVIGAGTMGHGIAQVAAMAGFETRIQDVSEERLQAARESVTKNLAKGVELGKVEAGARDAALARLGLETTLEAAVAGADLVIEAVPEDLALKKQLFASLDRCAPAHAILATNTSSLGVTEIAAATARPSQVLGLHFFNPVHVMKLLEIIRGHATSEDTLGAARAFGERLDKTVIMVKDVPGFATSRLGIALGNEAMRMVEQGVASAADIDTAMELGYRHPMGPLRLTDLVGLDVRLAISTYLHQELGGEQFRPPLILKKMVAAGKLGKKSGEGFYKYAP